MGTCMSHNDCDSQGGVNSGICAQGFGTCCLFVKEGCGIEVDRNHTYIRNPGFPDKYEDKIPCRYTIQTVNKAINHLRLDFETFSIKGPSSTFEDLDNGGECLDKFTVRVSSNT